MRVRTCAWSNGRSTRYQSDSGRHLSAALAFVRREHLVRSPGEQRQVDDRRRWRRTRRRAQPPRGSGVKPRSHATSTTTVRPGVHLIRAPAPSATPDQPEAPAPREQQPEREQSRRCQVELVLPVERVQRPEPDPPPRTTVQAAARVSQSGDDRERLEWDHHPARPRSASRLRRATPRDPNRSTAPTGYSERG